MTPSSPNPPAPKSIEEQFREYKARTFPGQHSRRVEAQIRSTFYAGAGSVVAIILNGTREDSEKLVTDVVQTISELIEPPVDPTQN
jgi:hypothetical protein